LVIRPSDQDTKIKVPEGVGRKVKVKIMFAVFSGISPVLAFKPTIAFITTGGARRNSQLMIHQKLHPEFKHSFA
jgi:hypothetical protein